MDAALCDKNQFMFSHVLFSLLCAGFEDGKITRKIGFLLNIKCVHSMSVNKRRVKQSSSYILTNSAYWGV